MDEQISRIFGSQALMNFRKLLQREDARALERAAPAEPYLDEQCRHFRR
jgi:hypothetical protein